MFYTLILLLLWLTHGTPTVTGSFSGWLIALIIAILADIYFQSPWFGRKP